MLLLLAGLGLGAIGATGALYMLFNLWWPGWYLDWVYQRAAKRMIDFVLSFVTKGKFIIDVFEDKVKLVPNKPLIIFKEGQYSYQAMDRKAVQVARACMEIGAPRGCTIAIMIYNNPVMVWTYLGLMKAGYQIALVNFNLRLKSLAHALRASGANILIVGEGDALIQAVLEVAEEISDFTIYTQGPHTEHKAAHYPSFDTIVERMSTEPVDRSVRKHVTPNTPNVLIYTSGTTGLPKPAICTQARCLAVACGFEQAGMNSDDILYQPLPMYHTSALVVGFGNVITHGSTMVLRDKFSASHFWDDCRKHNVTFIQYIGEVFRYLLAQPKNKLDGVNKIRVACGNGLRHDIWTEFQERFNIPWIYEVYGQTEAPIGLANISNKAGACGRLSPYMKRLMQVELVKFDLEAQAPYRNGQGRCVKSGPEEAGLLIAQLLEGVREFDGYRGKKSDTDKKIIHDVFVDGDRYYNSGDLLRTDKEHYLYFVDRVGDTFRWKGENVSTVEVGNTLTELPFIHDANVYGVFIEGNEGRAGMAALQITDLEATELTSDQLDVIYKHVHDVLPVYARPRFLRVQGVVEMTSTFKQQKTALVREGFDIAVVKDPLYYLNIRSKKYETLDENAFIKIMGGKAQL